MGAYSFFKGFHSGFRYIVLLLILVAVIQSLVGWFGNKPYTEVNRKMNLFALISAHVQLLIGLVLYFLSPLVQFTSAAMKDAETRYWTIEHITMMIIAVVLVTIGHSRSKKAVMSKDKHRTIAIFYLVAILVIITAVMQSHRPLLGMTH